ncbi:MAG: hypothetical protein RJA36_949 [Pseudomonadota bacterium]|jgi:type IV pilus assembly protein PilY1
MKKPHSGWILLGTLLLAGSSIALTLSDLPLFVTGSVAPNVVLTLDDSASMRRAYLPEICKNDDVCADLDNRWSKSSYANSLYYNPQLIYPAPLNADLSRLDTSFTKAWRNGFYTVSNPNNYINLATGYRPTAVMQMGSNTLNCKNSNSGSSNINECYMGHFSQDLAALGLTDKQADRPTYAYYYNYDANLQGCSGSKSDNACYRLIRVGSASGPGNTDERQNFANWYSFYRTRNLTVISAASLAFAELDPSVRVGWQALNSCRGSETSLLTTSCDGWSGGNGSNAIKEFRDTQHRQDFYDWLFALPSNGDTPLRQAMMRAGDYFSMTSGADSPYNNIPGNASSGQYDCRRNFHVMMTDGVWNDNVNGGGNRDSTSTSLPASAGSYNPDSAYSRVYRDDSSDTLADLAFRYWSTDLAPTLDDKLTAIKDAQDSYDLSGAYGQGDGNRDRDEQVYWNARNNPATWQHMSNFTIGLGLSDYLGAVGLNWAGDTYSGSFLDIANGRQTWPRVQLGMGESAPGSAVYGLSTHDLWHAAVNSRGQFFSAESPAALKDAFASSLRYIRSQTSTAAALAANSTQADADTQIFKAQFDTSKWNGQLFAYRFDKSQGALSAVQWSAAAAMPAHYDRKIFMRTASGSADFAWNNLSTSQKSALNQSDNLGSARLNWLRGDHSQELRFGGSLRNREVKAFEKLKPSDPGSWELGDIISSDPRYVGTDPEGYDSLSGYKDFAKFKAARMPVIYVGANDGMLHAFAAPSDPTQSGAGKELFAVIPNGVFGNLAQLANPGYVHRYYVDGSPSSGDAYLNNGNSHSSGWNTVVLSGLRAGGKSIIAVDATFAGGTSQVKAEQFMWEYTEADMGFTFSQPQIARLNDGSWAAVFGNGYPDQASNGGAFLYLVDLNTGTLLKKIRASAGVPGSDNGLSTPTLIDSNGDGIKDYAYAGDLQGNMWKFDLSASSSSGWGVANGGAPLFVAQDASGNRQPITVPPAVVKEASVRGFSWWVLFGTGRYLSSDDLGSTSMSRTQSFYGLWDNGGSISGRSSLVVQSVTGTSTLNGYNVRLSTDNAVDLGTNTRGWYMDLPSSGERVVSPAITVFDNVDASRNRVIFVTNMPASDPCTGGGTSWLMELHFNGRRPWTPVFDLDANGQFDTLGGKLPPISGVQAKDGFGIMAMPTWIDKDTEFAYKLTPGTEKGEIAVIRNKGRGKAGLTRRVSWQQLL